MAPCAFSSREPVRREVRISSGKHTQVCRALIDADFWPTDGVPVELGGFLEMTRRDWEALAESDRLVLTLQESGEPYRMILDSITGRFVARQL